MEDRRPMKRSVRDLAAFGGEPAFPIPISTSNLVRPPWTNFHAAVDILYDQGAEALVERLESRLAAYHHSRHAVSMANGFWALVLCIRALALPGRVEVVMPSLTYRRLDDVVAWAGLVPHFCEVDPHTLAISAAAARTCINDRSALLIGVHPIVNTCDALALEALAADTGLPLLFDSVESMHETVQGRRVGTFGRAEVFSLHASKLVNGFEGGYVITQDDQLAQRLRAMRDRGESDESVPPDLGVNSRLHPLHAAMAMAGLEELPAQIDRNRARYRLYQSRLQAVPSLRLLAFDESESTSFKTIVVELRPAWPLSRDRTVELLNREGILARAYYSPPLHRKRPRYPVVHAPLPLTDQLSQRFMLLPCGHHVDEQAIEQTVELLTFLEDHAGELRAGDPG
jgi:dTDP-4-amino-4,6-dideoxygalactose transaminase